MLPFTTVGVILIWEFILELRCIFYNKTAYIFQAFNSNIEVNNYPMPARTQAEIEKLEMVKEQREVEIEELAVSDLIILKCTHPHIC